MLALRLLSVCTSVDWIAFFFYFIFTNVVVKTAPTKTKTLSKLDQNFVYPRKKQKTKQKKKTVTEPLKKWSWDQAQSRVLRHFIRQPQAPPTCSHLLLQLRGKPVRPPLRGTGGWGAVGLDRRGSQHTSSCPSDLSPAIRKRSYAHAHLHKTQWRRHSHLARSLVRPRPRATRISSTDAFRFPPTDRQTDQLVKDEKRRDVSRWLVVGSTMQLSAGLSPRLLLALLLQLTPAQVSRRLQNKTPLLVLPPWWSGCVGRLLYLFNQYIR